MFHALALAMIPILAWSFSLFHPDFVLAEQSPLRVLRVIGTRQGLGAAQVTAVCAAPGDTLWAGTSAGLQRLVEGRIQATYTPAGSRPLPDNRTTVAAQDGYGGLWLGTYAGLVHWSAAGFQTLGRMRGLPDTRITAVVRDSSGSLWVGTWRGACVAVQGGFRIPAPLPPVPVVGLLVNPAGDVYVATAHEGLWRCEKGRCDSVQWTGRLEPPALVCSVLSPDGTVWVGTVGAGIWRCRPNSLRAEQRATSPLRIRALLSEGRDSLYAATGTGLWLVAGRPRADGPLLADVDATLLFRDGAGTVWGGTAGKGLWRLAGGTIAVSRLPADTIRALTQDGHGDLWASTEAGLWRRHHERWQRQGGVPATWAPHRLISDSAGRIWGLTGARGLVRICDSETVSISSTSALPPGAVHVLLWDPRGVLWIGSDRGLSRYDGEFFRPCPTALDRALISSPQRPPAATDGVMRVYALALDDRGTLWIGHGRGLAQCRPGRPDRLEPVFGAGLRNQTVRALAAAPHGVMWAGTDSGLVRLQGGRARRLTLRDGLPRNRVQALAWDPDRGLWIGTPGGLGLLRHGRTIVYRRADGLPSDMIVSLHASRDGDLWIGTLGGGGARYDGRTFQHLGRREGLPGQIVHAIGEDGAGNIWLATDKGLSEIPATAAVSRTPAWILGAVAASVLLAGVTASVRRRRRKRACESLAELENAPALREEK